MKLTRYEYTHNPDGTRKYIRLGSYFPPRMRVIYICVIYVVMFGFLFNIFRLNKTNLLVEIIKLLIIFIVPIFVFEYNPFYIFSFMIRLLYRIFSKQSVHKKLVYSLLSDYRNIVDFEKKLYITKVRISFFNPKKILYSKNNKRGYISLKCIKFDKKVVTNEYLKCENDTDYISYLKSATVKLYRDIKKINSAINL